MRMAWLFLIAACGHGATTTPPAAQSFHDGVQALCDLPDHVPEAATPEQRLSGAGTWADQHVTNADARKLGNLGSLALDKELLADAAKRAAITRCKLLDNGMALQSFADGMKAICTAPAGDPGAYMRAHLLNPEVIRMLATLGEKNPADRVQALRDATARAGLAECPALHAASPMPDVPKVSASGLPAVIESGPTLVATEKAIVIEGKAIVALDHGAVAADELEGGAMGMRITHVKAFLDAYAAELKTKGALPPLQLAIAPTLPYRLLVQIAFTAKSAGFTTFELLVDAGSLNALEIEVPVKRAPGEKPKGAGVIVTIVPDKLLLWSMSGEEGTLQQPKLTTTQPAELAPVAREIAKRRHDDAIIVQADGQVPVQRVAEVMAAVHDAFPKVQLSTGFE